jgi:hypothetical protein
VARKLSKDKQVYLQSLANSGDMIAKAIIELAQDVTVLLGANSGGVIIATCQLVDGVGNMVQKVADIQIELNTATGGAALATVTGTTKLSVPEELWLQTTAAGVFAFSVTNPTPGELSLVRIMMPDGVNSFVEFQF